MSAKGQTDPYDPCPCGSGKKYKFCCAAIDKENDREKRKAEALFNPTTILPDGRIVRVLDHLEQLQALADDDDSDDADEADDVQATYTIGVPEDDDEDDRDWDASFARTNAIVGDDDDADFGDGVKRLFTHLKANLKLPCEVTGSEDFRWEEPYVIGGWSPRAYKRLRETQPSYQDSYQLLSIRLDEYSQWMMCSGEDIASHVKRISDGKEFVLGLCELKAIDKGSPNYQLLDDYSVWFWNNR